MIRQGGLARFIPAPHVDVRITVHAPVAWDTVTAEYVPVPWGAVVLVLDIAAERVPESHWVEVLVAGRVLLALSDDLGPARDSAP